jgi:hypothetical protein
MRREGRRVWCIPGSWRCDRSIRPAGGQALDAQQAHPHKPRVAVRRTQKQLQIPAGSQAFLRAAPAKTAGKQNHAALRSEWQLSCWARSYVGLAALVSAATFQEPSGCFFQTRMA